MRYFSLRNDNEKTDQALPNLIFLLIYIFFIHIPNQCTESLVLQLLYPNQYLIIALKIILNYSNAIMNLQQDEPLPMPGNANLAFCFFFKEKHSTNVDYRMHIHLHD